MSNSILILGGYGNFGKRIAEALVKSGVNVIINGRDKLKAENFVSGLGKHAQIAIFDFRKDLSGQLEKLKPLAVINTCGPFQNEDYTVAKICINRKIHYIDLADGRDFVVRINSLDKSAKEAGVSVISGASTVPGLSSAVIEHFKEEFASIEELRFGISPGQKAERGFATTKGILTYVGKKLKPFAGQSAAYGWQDIYRQQYPGIGKRWMANCDIPDLDLFPEHYGIKKIKFSAGLEISILHLGLWGISWLVRLGMPVDITKYAGSMLSISNWFNCFGSADGGMHIIINGYKEGERLHKREWYIIAKDGYGPYIPTISAIVMAKKLASGIKFNAGAYACLGHVTYNEYMAELAAYPITVHIN